MKVNSSNICEVRYGTGNGASTSIPKIVLGDGSVVYESKRNIFAYGPNFNNTHSMMEFAEDYDKKFFLAGDGTSTSNIVAYDMAYGNGVFVAICKDGGGNACIYASKYGGKWTKVRTVSLSSSVSTDKLAIAYNKNTGKFSCVAGDSSGVHFLSSDNGTVWSSTQSSLSERSINYFGECGNGFLVFFYAVGTSGDGTNAYYSEDGITYTKNTALSSTSVQYVGFAVNESGLIVIIGHNETTYKIYSKTSISTGSLTQRKNTSSTTGYYRFVCYSGRLGKFFISDSTTDNKLLVSSNGTTWSSTVTLPSSLNISMGRDARKMIFEFNGYLWLVNYNTKNLFRTADGSSWSVVTATNASQKFRYVFSPTQEAS